nr:transcriptional activator spt7 [Quercus suber]
MLRQRWAETESNIAALFGTNGQIRRASKRPTSPTPEAKVNAPTTTSPLGNAKTSAPPKKAARTIDDDYGDDDDEEEGEGEEDESEKASPLKVTENSAVVNGTSSHAVRSPAPLSRVATIASHSSSGPEQIKSSEDVRKQLEEEKKTAAEGAKRSFQSMFFTFEHDHDAMLEQQKLDELDREVENEISGGPHGEQDASGGVPGGTATQGSLGSADLGASSLTLKHLIARIDAKRQMVKASDDKLRTLISEVRKGRSKWASEDKVGQEELYEAAEKVLMELKAMTEYAQPFLQRVSKREAPDYSNVIKQPMDIGTMIRKLKQFSYKSKKEFVEDLNLIWGNCLKYNSTPDHPFRKKALYMRKETDKLTPLIPEIVVRDRAEVEAEERRQHSPDPDDSDEDEPIMASRGRKAPKKGASKGAPSSARKAPAVGNSENPAADVKPAMHASASSIRNEFLRADSEAQDASSAGYSTPPPPGTAPPFGVNSVHSSGIANSQTDLMDIDGVGQSLSITSTDADDDDTELKTWKQVTKKDRAMAAADRHRLFRGHALNGDEPALLRTKAMMRRWTRQQKSEPNEKTAAGSNHPNGEDKVEESAMETLAEGIEKDEDSTLPDYYHALSAIPDLDERWRWAVDSEGHVAPQIEDWMRIYPKDNFKSTDGNLNRKIEANLRQMQDTRKICSKIGIVKQMQLQGQVSGYTSYAGDLEY